jgi:hypothetical protein
VTVAPHDPVASSSRFDAGGFFVLRAAVLPIDLLQSAARVQAPDKDPLPGPDTRRACDLALQSWIRDPWAQSAIYLASPSLSDRLTEWLSQSTPDAFEAIRPALFRYFVRMTTRATPFGLFASFSTGRLDCAARFELGPREALRRHSWLDLGFLCPFVERQTTGARVRQDLRFTPNTTLYKHDDGWRYVEQHLLPKQRQRNLARVASTDILDLVITSCRGSLALTELNDLILRHAPEVTSAEVADYLGELIDSQVLVPTFAPILTGPDPLQRLIDLSAGGSALTAVNTVLTAAAKRLAAIDQHEVESLRGEYKALAPWLMGQLDGADEQHLFHVDLRREVPQLSLPESIVPDLLGAVDVLRRICPPSWPHPALERFRKRFVDRYGDREVDLMAALDEDSGIGFEIDPASRRGEGLLAEFRFDGHSDARNQATVSGRLKRLVNLAERAWSGGQRQIGLSEEDVAQLGIAEALPLPDVFTVFGSVLSLPHGEAAADKPGFMLQSVSAGVGLFGRFCRSDAELAVRVKALLQQEEALRPEAIFAELVHLPGDRTGNVICRPALRSKDLPYLG